MEWKEWKGKYIFLRTKSGKVYSGEVTNIDDSSKPLIFVYILDKFGNHVSLSHSEITEIKEESR